MDHPPKKRKPPTVIESSAKKPRPQIDSDAKLKGTSPPQAQDSPLFRPHAPILQELAAKYNILPASVISSTPIRKRLVHITSHLVPTAATATATSSKDKEHGNDDEASPTITSVEAARQDGTAKTRKRPCAVLLYARPAEVCKMITVAETCKRLLEEAGQMTWYQYNQLFDLPTEDAERAKRKKRREAVVEETVLLRVNGEDGQDGDDDDSESDAFETMQSRFEKAVLPPPSERTTKSLRIFLATTAMPELKAKDGVTLQASGH